MARTRRRLLLAAAVAAAAGPVVVRRRWSANPDPTGGAPLDLPAGRELAVPTPDGGTLAARVMGPAEGPVVVCAHGWTADRRVWSAVARRLIASGHRVVVYDERGHGGSRAGRDGLAIAALGDDVAAVLEHLDLRGVVLAGHSMGGMAVEAFAIQHKDVLSERVAGLALISTAGGDMALPGGIGERAAVLIASDAVTRADRHPVLGPVLVRGTFGSRPSMAALRATAESFAAADPMTRKTFLQAISEMDLKAQLPAVDARTVVVSGTRDTLVPHARSRRLAGYIPGAEFVAIKGAGHQLVFETPDRVAEILADLVPRQSRTLLGSG